MVQVCPEIKLEEKEMRDVFAEVLDEIVTEDKRVIYLDADIMNSLKTVEFGKKHPENTINCGIQEANMIGVAGGMSATGLIPFVHSFAPFVTRRVMDQVHISGAYPNLNIRIMGTDPGILSGVNGGTHTSFEDVGLMRCIPNVTIIDPCDSVMLKDILWQTKELHGMFYIRLSRKVSEQIYCADSTFKIGVANTIREGSDVSIIASGVSVADACHAAEVLKKEGIQARVIDMFTIKPIDKEAIIKAAKETGAIVTVENHNIINGLGSAVAEVLSEEIPTPLLRLGARDRFGEVGSMSYLKQQLKMDIPNIVEAAKEVINKKLPL